MAYVNYIKENEAFIVDASDKNLCANARLLWYAVFHVFNQRANGGVWPDGLISINNKTLLSFVPFSEDALVKARNQLAQAGFIRYRAGERRSANPQYGLVLADERHGTSGSDGQSVNAASANNGFYPQISGKTEGKTDGKTYGKTDGKTYGKKVDQYPNYNQTENINQTPYFFDDDEDDDMQRVRARDPEDAAEEAAYQACVRKVQTACVNAFGRRLTTAAIQRLVQMFRAFGAETIIDDVVRHAAQHNASDPVAYIRTLLSEAKTMHALNPEAWRKLRFLTDCLHDESFCATACMTREEVLSQLMRMGKEEQED